MGAENWLKAELDRASREVAEWPEWKREAMKVKSASQSAAITLPKADGQTTNTEKMLPEK